MDKEQLMALCDQVAKDFEGFWEKVPVRTRKGLANEITSAADSLAGWVSAGNQVGKGLMNYVMLKNVLQDLLEAIGVDDAALGKMFTEGLGFTEEPKKEEPQKEEPKTSIADAVASNPKPRRGRKKKIASNPKGTGTTESDSSSDY